MYILHREKPGKTGIQETQIFSNLVIFHSNIFESQRMFIFFSGDQDKGLGVCDSISSTVENNEESLFSNNIGTGVTLKLKV